LTATLTAEEQQVVKGLRNHTSSPQVPTLITGVDTLSSPGLRTKEASVRRPECQGCGGPHRAEVTFRTSGFLPPCRPTMIMGRGLADRAAKGRGRMQEQPVTLGIQLAIGPEQDAEQVAEATLRLRRELLDLDVEAVELPSAGEPPPGSRAVELAALGALLVTMGKSQLLGSVVSAVRSWLAGSAQPRSIKLELDGDTLELSGVSSKEQRRLTDEWLARHTSR
jgi:hypothetical protein